jgi:peptidoglycan/xylan/chitin deacetylase (PgdA/CDA1 family)
MNSRVRMEGMACLSFDDGYVDNLGAAREILCELGVPATIFIPTGFVGRPYFWWDALFEIRGATSDKPELVRRELKAQFPHLDLDRGDAEAEWFAVWDDTRRHPLDVSYRSVDELAARLGVSLEELPRPVTATELKSFAQWPFEIGSHGVSHRSLPSLSHDELRSELLTSRAYLENVVGGPVPHFSYPFGLFDHEVAQFCRGVGYSCGVSLIRDNRLSYSNPFDIPRIDGADGDVDELEAELNAVEENNYRDFFLHTLRPPAQHATESPVSLRQPSPDDSRLVPQTFRGGDLFRSSPINRDWGFYRGTALDRPFIDEFVRTHQGDLFGRAIEIKEPEYFNKFARPGAKIDILDIDPENSSADIIDDLQTAAKIADNTYDCVILTQVLQLIPDYQAALATVARILRPGGVLLVTVCGITQGVLTVEGAFHWSFFQPGLKRALSPHFDTRKTVLHSHGNVGLAASFLMGLTTDDVPSDLWSVKDPEYPIVVTARAVKPYTVPAEIAWLPAVSKPRITVIIPLFNAEATIKETLDSVSRQTLQDYEIIVVDDGSTDASRKVVDELAGKSSGRITVLEHAGNVNRGLSLSRNLALAHATGEMIVFLDSDDTIHPSKFEHDVSILEAHPEAAAVVGRTLWWWDGEENEEARMDEVLRPADRVVHPPEFFEAYYQTRTAESPPCVHSWMVRKSTIDRIEPFDPHVMTYEDQKFLADLSLRFPIYVASTCLCDYRRKKNSLWATAVTSGTDAIAHARFAEWKAEAAKRVPASS